MSSARSDRDAAGSGAAAESGAAALQGLRGLALASRSERLAQMAQVAAISLRAAACSSALPERAALWDAIVERSGLSLVRWALDHTPAADTAASPPMGPEPPPPPLRAARGALAERRAGATERLAPPPAGAAAVAPEPEPDADHGSPEGWGSIAAPPARPAGVTAENLRGLEVLNALVRLTARIDGVDPTVAAADAIAAADSPIADTAAGASRAPPDSEPELPAGVGEAAVELDDSEPGPAVAAAVPAPPPPQPQQQQQQQQQQLAGAAREFVLGRRLLLLQAVGYQRILSLLYRLGIADRPDGRGRLGGGADMRLLLARQNGMGALSALVCAAEAARRAQRPAELPTRRQFQAMLVYAACFFQARKPHDSELLLRFVQQLADGLAFAHGCFVCGGRGEGGPDDPRFKCKRCGCRYCSRECALASGAPATAHREFCLRLQR